jgi:hypothetical protein
MSKTGSVAAAIVIGCMTAGIGATPALASVTAAPTQIASESNGVASVFDTAQSISRVDDNRLPAGEPEPSPGSQPRKGVPIGPIVNFIKSVGSAAWNACVKAAKAGWSKTVAWWNGLASWIRTGITWLANQSASAIIQAIIDWVIHH